MFNQVRLPDISVSRVGTCYVRTPHIGQASQADVDPMLLEVDPVLQEAEEDEEQQRDHPVRAMFWRLWHVGAWHTYWDTCMYHENMRHAFGLWLNTVTVRSAWLQQSLLLRQCSSL